MPVLHIYYQHQTNPCCCNAVNIANKVKVGAEVFVSECKSF